MDYTKTLEEQNEQLQGKLAERSRWEPEWRKLNNNTYVFESLTSKHKSLEVSLVI